MFFYAIDGDNVGQHLERLILEEKLSEVSEFSLTIARNVDFIKKYMIEHGALIIFSAGDGLLAKTPLLIDAKVLIQGYSELTFSIGIGDTAPNSLLALKKAKGLGKSRIETQFTQNYESSHFSSKR